MLPHESTKTQTGGSPFSQLSGSPSSPLRRSMSKRDNLDDKNTRGFIKADLRGRSLDSLPRSILCMLCCCCALLALYSLYSMRGVERYLDPAKRCDLASYDTSALELDLKRCNLDTLSPLILRFERLRKLDLSHNQIETLPPLPQSIEVLFCTENSFQVVPGVIAALRQLRMLSFRSNKLRMVSSSLPPSIEWLILTNNRIPRLPSRIGYLSKMRKLMLSNNLLETLPDSMRFMKQLEVVRLANNRLTSLPDWLTTHETIAWAALASNPLFSPPAARASFATVRYEDFDIIETIGEGSSSNVYRARRKVPGAPNVAMKLYKSINSSDGRNIDELIIGSALDHASILRLEGYFEAPQLGAVLEWTVNWQSLGRPPSFDSVTRDTYAEGAAFSPQFAATVACNVANALEYVHANGIMHGDLYAHNVLVRPSDGSAKLADWGAAVHYGVHSEFALRFERIEMRAFAILLEELLVRVEPTDEQTDDVYLRPMRVLSKLGQGELERRPLFATVAKMLQGGCERRRHY